MFSVTIKIIAYCLILIAIFFKMKDLIKDSNNDKHRDIVDLLLLVLDIVFVYYTKIK